MSTDPKSTYYDHGGVETVEILRAKLFPEQLEGYLLGNIIKYASRLNYKGDPQRDSEKLVIYATLLRDVMREHDQNASETRDPQMHDGEPIDASGQEQARERHDIVPDDAWTIDSAFSAAREGHAGAIAWINQDDGMYWDEETQQIMATATRWEPHPPDRPLASHCPDGGACKHKCGLEPCKGRRS